MREISPMIVSWTSESALFSSVRPSGPIKLEYRQTMGANIEMRSSPPPRKRARVETIDSPLSKLEPRLFAPFRALGLITNGVPFVLQTRSHKGATDGPRIHLVTCLGKAWAMWEGGKMGLLFVGECSYTPPRTFVVEYSKKLCQVRMRLPL